LEGIPEEAGGMVKNVKAGVVWTGDHQAGKVWREGVVDLKGPEILGGRD
jgi:hypothetical protein